MQRGWRPMLLSAVSGIASASACGAALFVVDPAAAQEQAAPLPPAPAAVQQVDPLVRRLVVTGNQRVEASTVLSYVPLRPGDALTTQLSDAIIKALFATNLFADVQLSLEQGVLTIRVIENPILNRVIFEGVKALKQEDLDKEVQVKPRGVFTQARAQADVQRIIELYRRAGRFGATVTPSVRELPQNRVDLIFTVTEGPTTGVRSINFIGNKAFSDKELRAAVVTEQSAWWKILTTNDNYDPDRLDYDRELLRQFYSKRGFADFRIISAVAELTPDQKDFFITFTIDEGPQFDWGEVKVETELDRLPEAFLQGLLPIRSGRRYDGSLVEDAIDALTFVAGTSGYANVDINPVTERDRANRKLNITFEVNEGPRVFIERIDIIGNTATVDSVIRRELRLLEGDAFNRVLLDRSRARLRGLGYFSKVEIEEKPGSEPDRAVVEVQLEEQPTGELALQAGFSNNENFLLDVSVSQRNLRGRGQFLRLRARTSSLTQQLDLSFSEPRFLGRNLSAGIDLFLLQQDFLRFTGNQTTLYGGSVRAGFPLTERTGLGLTYTLRRENVEVADVPVPFTDGTFGDICDRALSPIGEDINPSRPLTCDAEGDFTSSVFGYRFNFDRRNDPIVPTGGFNIGVSQDLAGLGGNVQYVRSELEGGIYKGLWGGLRASFTVSAGYIFGWDGDDVRINDRFFKGGSTFRGFDIFGVGPRQLSLLEDEINNQSTVERGQALGANAFGIGTVQIDFPLGLPKEFGLTAAAFYEFGTVGVLDDSSSPRGQRVQVGNGLFRTNFVDDTLIYRASAGVSIFWDSPFGPVQFDFAEVLNRAEFDQPLFFNFRTRTRF